MQARTPDTVKVNGETLPADRVDLIVKGKPLTLWYGRDDGRWLALESVAKGGRILRYEPELLPETSLLLSAVAEETQP